ncbi:MAG TPA: hypothetical protein V6C81_25395 [Planktothrix sp.]|jgi:hypothetical protein
MKALGAHGRSLTVRTASCLVLAVILTFLLAAFHAWGGTWLPLLPRNVLTVSLAGALASVAGFLAALAVGLRARSSAIARPPGFPKDVCGETARFINSYNIVKEAADTPIESDGAEWFAVELYLQAIGRSPIGSTQSIPKREQ